MKEKSTVNFNVFRKAYDNSEKNLKDVIGFIGRALGLSLIGLLLMFNVSAQHVNFEWATSLGSSGRDESHAIALDSEGNVYVTGYFEGSMTVDLGTRKDTLVAMGGADVFLAKYSPRGNCIWARRMGGSTEMDWGLALAIDTADNVYVAGVFATSADFNPGGSGGTLTAIGYIDMFLAKYDSSGNYLWAKSVGTNVYMNINYGLAVDGTTNEVYVVGGFSGSGDFDPGAGIATLTAIGNVDVFLAKYDQNGSYLWAKNIGGSGGASSAYSVAIDAARNVYVTGILFGTADFNPGGSGGVLTAIGTNDVFLAKYDRDGNYHWAKNMGGDNNDYGHDVAVDGTGNVYVTGYFISAADFNPGGNGGLLNSSGNTDVFLAKYDSSGNYLWANAMGSSGRDAGFGVAVDKTNNVYVTGLFSYSVDFDPDGSGDTLTTVGNNVDDVDNDVFVAKYDSSGNYVWAKSMGSRLKDLGRRVVVDNINNVYLTGWFSWSANFNPDGINGELALVGDHDVFVVKLSQGCEIVTTFMESACDSFSFNNVTYNVSGVYRDTFTSFNDCDSIVVLDLTITGQTSENTVVTGHYCDSVTFNGITYLASGVYTQQYSNTGGCDSNITYDLTIGESNSGQLTLAVCDSLVLDDKVYSVSGTYSQVLTNASGCDSTLTLELIVNSSPQATVVLAGTTLTATNADEYQWLDCDNGYAFLPGATQQSFTPTVTGNYTVVITTDGCSDTAECMFVEVGSYVNQLGLDNQVQVYPNPAKSHINIQMQKVLNSVTIRLVNILGQLVNEQVDQQGDFFTLDISQYTPGIYFLDISKSGNAVRVKVVKE